MYYCRDCDSFFDETETIMTHYNDYDTCYNGIKYLCPYCKSEDFEEAEQCKSCGEYFSEADIENDMCDSCRVKLQKEAAEFIEKYNPEEREYVIQYLVDL